MKQKQVKVFIEKSSFGYSAYMDDTPLSYNVIGEGRTVEETIADFNKSYEGMRETLEKLRDLGVKMAVNSNKSDIFVKDLIARNLPIETSAHPAYDGIIVCLVCFRITVDAF